MQTITPTQIAHIVHSESLDSALTPSTLGVHIHAITTTQIVHVILIVRISVSAKCKYELHAHENNLCAHDWAMVQL